MKEIKTEGEVIWLDGLIDGSGGKPGMSTGEIVGQNVKLELIRPHCSANEWFIVIMDRQWEGTIWPLCSEFTSLSPSYSVFLTECKRVEYFYHKNKL